MKVAKFGGTSLANGKQITKVCDIITSDPQRKVIVVSAPGKRCEGDIKVTDLLINLANSCLENRDPEQDLNLVLHRYQEIINDLNLSQDVLNLVESDLRSRISKSNYDKYKFMDLLKAAGEDNTAKIVAEYLKSIGFNAKYVNPKDAGLMLSDEYGNARVLPESFENLKSLADFEGITIFPGFFGYSLDGNVVTFPRGGSDITGSILAAALKADLYENFTDVDFVFSANPSVIKNPKPIEMLTYREMRELSYAGFSVLHEETLEPVYRNNVPVCIKNTNNPISKGTLITPKRELKGNPITGIAGDKGFCTIYVSKYLMNREIGFGRKLLSILEDESISYEHIPSGIDNISVVIREKDFTKEREERILKRIRKELLADHIEIEKGLALIMLVGEGMQNTVGLTGRAASALAKENVNIEIINQGSSEVSLLFGIRENRVNDAIKTLYEEFFQ